jgi:hypothetical protein
LIIDTDVLVWYLRGNQAAKKAALETPDKVTWYPRGAEFMNGHPVDYDYDERIDG